MFLTRIADRLVDVGMNAVAAAIVAREIAPALAERWVDIITSAAFFVEGDSEIEWFHISHPGEGSSAVVGSKAEVTAQRQAGKPVLDGIGGNATRVAWEMLHRAEKHEIAIPEKTWTEAPSFVAGGVAQMWAQAIDEAAQRKGQ